MLSKNRKISKQKGVEICADLLFVGETTKEILRKMAESCGVATSTVEKWIKTARPIVQQRQEQAEQIKSKENEAAIIEAAKKLNITRERVLEEYAKLAFFDIRKIFTVDGGLKSIKDFDDDSAAAIAGLESYDEKEPESGMILGTLRKLKISEKRAALDSLCRVLGYNAETSVKLKGDPENPLQVQNEFKFIIEDYTNGSYTPEEPGS